jgi:hypothetical protein
MAETRATRFEIFRPADAPSLDEAEAMSIDGTLTPVETDGATRLTAAGYDSGHALKMLFAMPGLSLTHVWFKSGFPLPRHSHDADCLYYIIGGSLKLGTETLGAGDGFFVGRDVPYAYVPGEAGVQLLEIRTTDRFDIKMLADNPAFWNRAVATVQQKKHAWQTETMPAA